MDNLPPEILLIIAKHLASKSCCHLATTSKHYSWLLHDLTLWQYYAKRDLECPDTVFNAIRKSLHAHQVYSVISQCQANVDIDGTRFVQKCNQRIVPGCSFCVKHCDDNNIPLCRCCETHICEDEDTVCAVCQLTQAYRNGCKYKRSENGGQCGDKRKEGSDYCQSCVNRYRLEEPRPIEVVSCPSISGHYMIVTGDLVKTVISQSPEGQLTVLGRIPSRLTNETITSVNQLIPLTTEEIGIATKIGFVYSSL